MYLYANRGSVVIAVAQPYQLRGWRLVCCVLDFVIGVLCAKVEGVGEDGRMFMLSRPSEAEQISTLWGLYHQSLKNEAELKARLDFQVSVILVYECIIYLILMYMMLA